MLGNGTGFSYRNICSPVFLFLYVLMGGGGNEHSAGKEVAVDLFHRGKQDELFYLTRSEHGVSVVFVLLVCFGIGFGFFSLRQMKVVMTHMRGGVYFTSAT
jgi:hypothetical protein